MAPAQTKTKGAKKATPKPALAKSGTTTPALGKPPALVEASETEYQRLLPAAFGVAAADVTPFKALKPFPEFTTESRRHGEEQSSLRVSVTPW